MHRAVGVGILVVCFGIEWAIERSWVHVDLANIRLGDLEHEISKFIDGKTVLRVANVIGFTTFTLSHGKDDPRANIGDMREGADLGATTKNCKGSVEHRIANKTWKHEPADA